MGPGKCRRESGLWAVHAPLLTRRPAPSQQQAEMARMAQTQEEKLAAALRLELHNTSCQVQSLQAETESLRALVSGLGRALAFLTSIFTLNCTVVIWVRVHKSLEDQPIPNHNQYSEGC